METTLAVVVGTLLLLVAAGALADPIQDNSLNGYRAGWYPNYYKEKGPLTCPQTCEAWINGVAEHEASLAPNSRTTQVCKFGDRRPANEPVLGGRYLYGNQFDRAAVCFAADMNGKVQKSERFMCLCLARTQAECPDLVVAEIRKPEWDNVNKRSVITAVIKIIGSGAAVQSIARVIDPSTTQPGGAPYNAIANTPALAAGASAKVVFYLPNWVFNPDATLKVTADYKGMVQECNENNNTKDFHGVG